MTSGRKSNVSKALLHAPANSGESFADRAYKELEHQIITAQIKPGEWLTEIALSEQLGINRTPIREALQRLSRARLLEIVPRRGVRVTEVNVKDQLLLWSLDVKRSDIWWAALPVAQRMVKEIYFAS
jgi:DNA-binding FadR family transcriptional regulator